MLSRQHDVEEAIDVTIAVMVMWVAGLMTLSGKNVMAVWLSGWGLEDSANSGLKTKAEGSTPPAYS